MKIAIIKKPIRQEIRVPRNNAIPPTVNYIESHELSLLSLLAKKYPEKAIEYGHKGIEKNSLTEANR